MKTMSIRVIAAAALVLFGSASAGAATLYVNNSGSPACSDATVKASNTASAPWCTIGRAAWGSTNRNAPNASQAAAASDIVVVIAGTYNFSGNIANRFNPVYTTVNEGSSAASPITFIANGTVVLTAPTTQSPVIGCNGRDHIIWQGPFELDEANISISADTGTVVLVNATGCGVNGITIDGNGTPNANDNPPNYVDNHNGVRVEGCTGCFIRNSTIHDVEHIVGNHNGAGVMLYNSDDTVIEHNTFFNTDNAVFIKGVFGVLDHLERTIIRYNVMFNCDECITVSDSQDSRIYQNVIRDSQIGINLLGREEVTYYHPNGDWFFNNTIDNMSSGCIFVTGGNFHENVRVWNNITTNCANTNYREGANFSGSGAVIDWEHNNYTTGGTFADDAAAGSFTFATWKSTHGHDQAAPASIQISPMFANAAGDDFRLCTGVGVPHASCTGVSPARSLGVDLFDLDGDGSTVDVIPAGAYLNNSEVIGPPTGTLPSAPTNLRITTP